MFGENSFFSFFTNVKDKINSFFSSVKSISKKDVNIFNSISNNKLSESSEHNNYISYLLRKSSCKKHRKNKNKKFSKNLSNSYSINEDSYLSSTLSEISTKENFCLNESQITLNDEYDEFGNKSSLNNINEGEQDFKNYYRYNSSNIGKKHQRYFFEENNDASSFNEDNNNDIEYICFFKKYLLL